MAQIIEAAQRADGENIIGSLGQQIDCIFQTPLIDILGRGRRQIFFA